MQIASIECPFPDSLYWPSWGQHSIFLYCTCKCSAYLFSFLPTSRFFRERRPAGRRWCGAAITGIRSALVFSSNSSPILTWRPMYTYLLLLFYIIYLLRVHTTIASIASDCCNAWVLCVVASHEQSDVGGGPRPFERGEDAHRERRARQLVRQGVRDHKICSRSTYFNSCTIIWSQCSIYSIWWQQWIYKYIYSTVLYTSGSQTGVLVSFVTLWPKNCDTSPLFLRDTLDAKM